MANAKLKIDECVIKKSHARSVTFCESIIACVCKHRVTGVSHECCLSLSTAIKICIIDDTFAVHNGEHVILKDKQ